MAVTGDTGAKVMGHPCSSRICALGELAPKKQQAQDSPKDPPTIDVHTEVVPTPELVATDIRTDDVLTDDVPDEDITVDAVHSKALPTETITPAEMSAEYSVVGEEVAPRKCVACTSQLVWACMAPHILHALHVVAWV